MANIRIPHQLPLIGAVVVTIGAAALLAVESTMWHPTLTARLLTVTVLAIGPLTALRLAAVRSAGERKQIETMLEALCRADLTQADAEMTPDISHEPPCDPNWRRIYTLVRDCLYDHTQRRNHIEQARESAEIRSRRLATERDQLIEVLQGLSEPALAVNHYGEVIVANDAFNKLFRTNIAWGDRPKAESVIQCPDLLELLTDTRRRKTIAVKSSEIQIADASGKTHWYRIQCRGTKVGADVGRAADRNFTHGAVAVLTDITLQKVIQKRNAEFVAAVSHEMKTPLSSIKAYVELLADGEAEDVKTREEFLGVINGQTDRLQRLIDNLLNLARIEAGVVNVHKEERSLNGLLQEAMEVMRPGAEQKEIRLVSELSTLYLNVLADRDTLLQAAINLLSNAVKYTRNGGTVTIRSRFGDGSVVFEVTDTGVGLSPEDCQKVFEKFYRVKKDRDMAQGTGLGLPLVKHIVEDVHGGRVELESKLGEGSTFRVVLPGAGKSMG